MRLWGTAVVLLVCTSCSSSHSTGDAGPDTGSDAMSDAMSDATPPGECGPCDRPCCTRDPSSGARVDPFCPPSGLECEGPPLSCADRCPPVPAGCTLNALPPACDCGAVVCTEPDECASLSETQCWGTDGCAPIYDDDCCPSCRPLARCADCTDPAFFVCAGEVEVCGPGADPCGAAPSCGAPLDCSEATPNLGLGSCSIAGCVPAVESACLEGCWVSCRPVTAGSCEALCDIVEPPCPDGMVAEATGGCYSGFCIPGEVCGR